jgi:hypothetical protein
VSRVIGEQSRETGTRGRVGGFRISGLPPGTYRLSLAPSIDGHWWLESALLDGHDVTDGVFEVTATGPTPFMDRTLWSQGSRRLPQAAAVATDGTFSLRGLPGGVYGLTCVSGASAADLSDPAFLATAAAAAIPVTVVQGGRTIQDVVVGKRL